MAEPSAHCLRDTRRPAAPWNAFDFCELARVCSHFGPETGGGRGAGAVRHAGAPGAQP
jgi:hypothetical protein